MSNVHSAVRGRWPGFVCKTFPTLVKNCCAASFSVWFYFSEALYKGAEGVLSVQKQLTLPVPNVFSLSTWFRQ